MLNFNNRTFGTQNDEEEKYNTLDPNQQHAKMISGKRHSEQPVFQTGSAMGNGLGNQNFTVFNPDLDRPPSNKLSSDKGADDDESESSGSEESDDEEYDSEYSGDERANLPTQDHDGGLDVENIELMSEHDSQGSDQKPIKVVQNIYDIWKFVGVINY